MAEDREFEWDPAKAAANLRKHGITFNAARRVFADPFADIDFDAASSYDEDRYQAVGLIGGELVTVIYTDQGQRIRIISARRANTHERGKYNRGQGSR